MRPTIAVASVVAVLAMPASAAPPLVTGDQRRALQAVAADSMRGHLSFLASDLLGGRVTPSPGGDVAAEYIAAQLRRAGLEPLGDDAFFQTVTGAMVTPRPRDFDFRLTGGGRTVEVGADAFRLIGGPVALSFEEVPVRWVGGEETPPPDIAPGTILGITLAGDGEAADDPKARSRRRSERLRAFRDSGAAAVLIAEAWNLPAYFDRSALVVSSASRSSGAPLIAAADPSVAAPLRDVARQPGARLTLRLGAPDRQDVVLRNVAGLLRGSDPRLRETYVLVTAHYDGTGPQPGASGPDTIWNAANDDGSGTVAVIELATALARLGSRPRRSIVFMTFFGEEQGLLGARSYVAQPLVPLSATAAVLNLEHLGRTDSTEGDKRRQLGLTGFDFSDLSDVLKRAAPSHGVRVVKDPVRSDKFFGASDNLPFAEKGVVAHTTSVLYEDFADYHGPDDEWPKIDYENMEAVVRALGEALLVLAQSDEAPRWADMPATRAYREAARRLEAR